MIYYFPAYLILMLVIALTSFHASAEIQKRDEYICELEIQNEVLRRQNNNNNTEEQTND